MTLPCPLSVSAGIPSVSTTVFHRASMRSVSSWRVWPEGKVLAPEGMMEIRVSAVRPWDGASGTSGGVRVTPVRAMVAETGTTTVNRHRTRAGISHGLRSGIRTPQELHRDPGSLELSDDVAGVSLPAPVMGRTGLRGIDGHRRAGTKGI